MTLKAMLAAAGQMINGHVDQDAMIYFINQVVADMIRDMHITRTDIAYNNCLPRRPVEILDVRSEPSGDVVTYTFVPHMLRWAGDVPELPAWCHGAIVTYAVQRYQIHYCFHCGYEVAA